MKALLIQRVHAGRPIVEVLSVTSDELEALRTKQIKRIESACPNCSHELVVSAHVLRCRRCGYQEDRSFAA